MSPWARASSMKGALVVVRPGGAAAATSARGARACPQIIAADSRAKAVSTVRRSARGGGRGRRGADGRDRRASGSSGRSGALRARSSSAIASRMGGAVVERARGRATSPENRPSPPVARKSLVTSVSRRAARSACRRRASARPSSAPRCAGGASRARPTPTGCRCRAPRLAATGARQLGAGHGDGREAVVERHRLVQLAVGQRAGGQVGAQRAAVGQRDVGRGRAARIRSANRLPSGDSVVVGARDRRARRRRRAARRAWRARPPSAGASAAATAGVGRPAARLRTCRRTACRAPGSICGRKMRASHHRCRARGRWRGRCGRTRVRSRYDSMIGMPATPCAMPAWVWPATIASTARPGRQRARQLRRSRSSLVAGGQVVGRFEAVARAARVRDDDHHGRARRGAAAGPPRSTVGRQRLDARARRSSPPSSCAASPSSSRR